jgi:parallel beta-helix repeat protein
MRFLYESLPLEDGKMKKVNGIFLSAWSIVLIGVLYLIPIIPVSCAKQARRSVIMKKKITSIIVSGTFGFLFLLTLGFGSCNALQDGFKKYQEDNNPNAFRSITLIEASKPDGNMNKLSFGTSSGSRTNGKLNNEIKVNADGSINLYAHNANANAGKIAGSEDGITFYFKEVPADKNFKLRADAEVVFFALQGGRTELNGQEGFGLMARDCVPQYPGRTMADLKNAGWDDNYHAGSTGGTANMILVGGVKRGVRVYWRTGVTDSSADKSPEGIGDYVYDPTVMADASKAQFFYQPRDNLDYSQWPDIRDRPDFAPAGSKYTLYLEKTNSGFRCIITPPSNKGGDPNYRMNPYDLSVSTTEIGVGKPLEYFIPEPDMLTSINKKSYFVGFYASRSAEVKISNIHYEEADASDCAPRIDALPDQYTPAFTVYSPATTATADYTFWARANVEGNIAISVNGERLAEESGMGTWTVEKSNASGKPFCNFSVPVSNLKEGNNIFQIAFYPDKRQPNSKFLLTSTNAVTATFVVNRRTYGDSERDGNIYVAPDGKRTNTGTYNNPLNLDTAIAYVQPGQKIIMKDGVYTPLQVLIPRYNSGKPNADAPAAPVASNPDYKTDPYYKYHKVLEAEHRDLAVIDFLGHKDNRAFELRGDYWVLSGFHIRGSAPVKRKGLTIMGNYNRIEWVKSYLNGDTGMQISGENAEPKVLWPTYNVVAYCESFYNKDEARIDADGFAAKLTVGDGNRFEWCVAHHNVDDGWDLFTKKETGETGIVIIENCVAYENGYWLSKRAQNPDDWTVEWGGAGGNGFKLGGEGLSVKNLARNDLSFLNGGDGFTSNSNPALQLENCTAFNNNDRGFAVYGSGSSSVSEPVLSFESKQFFLLSIYPIGVSSHRNDAIFISAKGLNTDGNETGEIIRNKFNPGVIWTGGRYVNLYDVTQNIENLIVSFDLPISPDIETAPFENPINAPIKGKFVRRDSNGKFILNDFMKVKNWIGTFPGASGLY